MCTQVRVGAECVYLMKRLRALCARGSMGAVNVLLWKKATITKRKEKKRNKKKRKEKKKKKKQYADFVCSMHLQTPLDLARNNEPKNAH